jgi:hypothetical protein
MANGKSAAAGAIEGFLGGFERGTGLRRQRTSDKLALEDRQRRLVAEELQRGRQRVQDEQAAAEAARARESRDAEIEALERSRQLEDLELLLDRGITRLPTDATQGTPLSEADQSILSRTRSLRSDVGEDLAGTQPGLTTPEASPEAVGRALSPSAPSQDADSTDAMLARLGFRQTGTSNVDLINEAIAAPDPQKFLQDNPRAARVLKKAGLLSMVVGRIPSSEDIFTRTDRLADDFRSEATKTEAVARALAQANVAGDNAAGDQTLIFSFNNMLDPGVTVRRDDFERVAELGGLQSRAQRLWNMLGADGRMPEGVREQVQIEIRNVASVHKKRFENIRARFGARAEAFGVDPSLVVSDPFLGLDVGAYEEQGDPDEDAFMDALGESEPNLTDKEMAARLLDWRRSRNR